MKKSNEVKERIIEATIALITEGSGDVAEVNTRAIAEKAGVGIGLINYHFQTKEHLVEICVGRIIGNVIASFAPSEKKRKPLDQLKCSAKAVFDFLLYNPAISRVSILSDFKNPQPQSNTMKSVAGIRQNLNSVDMSDQDRLVLSFAFASFMQVLFLYRESSKDFYGYDITVKEQRDKVLDLLVDNLFGRYAETWKRKPEKREGERRWCSSSLRRQSPYSSSSNTPSALAR
jgi:AcrR family transcriptional regulator